SEEAVTAHRRALELAEGLDQPQAQFRAHTALYTAAAMRADLLEAHKIAEDLLATAARLTMPFARLIGHVTLGSALFDLGEFPQAERHLTEAHAIWRPELPSLTLDPCVFGLAMRGLVTLIRGDAAAGTEWIRNSLARAEEIRSPYNLAYASD